MIAETREQVAALNATIRDQLIATGRVDDTHAVTTAAGERIGIGDRVATRRNDRTLDVANRDTWTVTGIDPDGTLALDRSRGERRLPASYVQDHLELAYATTVYGAQGHTVAQAHLLVGEHTGAAAAYVGMTRGRETNVAHLVAGSVEDARAQWISTFSRDRAAPGAGPDRPAEGVDLRDRPHRTHRRSDVDSRRTCPDRPAPRRDRPTDRATVERRTAGMGGLRRRSRPTQAKATAPPPHESSSRQRLGRTRHGGNVSTRT